MFSSFGFVTKISLAFLVLPWMQCVPPTLNKSGQRVKSTNCSHSLCGLRCMCSRSAQTLGSQDLQNYRPRNGPSHVQVTIPNTEKYSLFEQLLTRVHERYSSWELMQWRWTIMLLYKEFYPFLYNPIPPWTRHPARQRNVKCPHYTQVPQTKTGL